MKTRSADSLKLIAASLLCLAVTSPAFASGNHRHRGHDRDREHHRDRDRDRDHDDCNSQPATPPTVAIVSPVDGTFTMQNTTTIQVDYTAPSGTIPLITLYRDGVAVDTYTIPTGSAAGSAVFVQDIMFVNGSVAFQASISYVASGGSGGDDDCDRDHHERGKKRGGDKSREQCHDDDDDDEGGGGGGGTTTTVLSNVVNVFHTIVVF